MTPLSSTTDWRQHSAAPYDRTTNTNKHTHTTVGVDQMMPTRTQRLTIFLTIIDKTHLQDPQFCTIDRTSFAAYTLAPRPSNRSTTTHWADNAAAINAVSIPTPWSRGHSARRHTGLQSRQIPGLTIVSNGTARWSSRSSTTATLPHAEAYSSSCFRVCQLHSNEKGITRYGRKNRQTAAIGTAARLIFNSQEGGRTVSSGTHTLAYQF